MNERILELILINYSDKDYLPMQNALRILGQAEIVITSHYHALVLSIANKGLIFSVMKDEVGDKGDYYNNKWWFNSTSF
ncbi:hypothetical protein [Aerococcus viridans]|uniref:hypothetical protein n=1 Tax=Aerococcus viridans TaxID=1377 RepID=UPI000FD931BE|nr:hypothetical protein [Aerococcus viridans]